MTGKLNLIVDHNTLQKLMGGLADGFLMTDVAGRITFMNKAAERLFEYEFDPDNDVPVTDVVRLENVETKEKIINPIICAMRTKKNQGLSKNIGFIRSDGSAYLSATCSPMIDGDGQVTGCTAIFRDVTRMRMLERKVETDHYYMRSVFEAARIGICTMNIRGEITDINEPALDTLGEDYTDVIGKQFGEAIHCINSIPHGCGKSDRCKFCVIRNNIEAAVLDDAFTVDFVVAVQTKWLEEPIWLQMFLMQVWDGSQKQIVLTLLNISKRKQKEHELLEARRHAEVASNTKTQFLANMSHEIRTPINGMSGMIDLTLRTSLTEEQRENLFAAKQCSDDLLRIINDILDYAKLESGKMKLETIDIDFHELLNRVSNIHAQMAESKGLFFNRPDVEGLPPFVRGDPLRIRQILHNLLTNALKFTLKGGVTLGVSVFSRQSQDYLEFFVEDTGIGMTMEEQVKLFKPFSQVDGSTTRRFGGTGLGLMIVKELVSSMGGEVSVTSRENKGSRFTVILPLILAEKADVEMKNRAVFMNPYSCPETAVNSTASASGISGEEDGNENDDIMDLLKYCEEKLSN